MGILLVAVVLIFLAHQGRTVLNSVGAYLMLSASQKMALTLRMSLLRHLDTLSAEYYENTPVGTVIYPLKEPIEEISYFGSDLLPESLRILLTTVFTLATMAVLSPVLTLAIVPLVPIFLMTRRYYRKRLASDADQMQADRLALNNFLQEHLSAVIPIQLLSQEKRQERRAFRLLARATRSQQKLYRTGIGFAAFSSLSIATAISAVVAYGGVRALTGSLSVGTLVAFYGFVNQIFEPLSGSTELYTRAQKAFASIRQVQSALTLRPSVTTAPSPVMLLRDRSGQIEFTDVSFGYHGYKTLLLVPSLQVLPGEHVAIAGENGAGKSTLAKLAARLYDPLCGTVRFGGEDLRNVHLGNLRQNICYIPRDPALFDGTIASNLRFSQPTATSDELHEALHLVGLSDIAADPANNLRRRIGPGGCQLSGGERQRLAIARALLQQPRVLILDEATSCLDPPAEEAVLRNVRRFLGASTLIVISHRLSTFSMFPRVLLLWAGQVIRDGSSDVVIAGGGIASRTLASLETGCAVRS